MITGDTNLTLGATDFATPTAGYTVDASALTGTNITLDEAAKQTFIGGEGNDTVYMANRLSATDSIDGGAGTNTIGINDASKLDGHNWRSLKNFQTFDARGLQLAHTTWTSLKGVELPRRLRQQP